MEEIVLFNIIYFLFAFFFIHPPNEIVSLGFSIPSLFSYYLGSEYLTFVHFHIARTTLTLFIHGLLPLGYYLFIGFNVPQFNLFTFECSIYWRIYLTVSLIIAIGITTIVYNWKKENFSNHPIVKSLEKLAQLNSNSSWKQIANEINIEFRRVEKFSSGSLNNRFYLTDNWFIKVNLYSIKFCQHRDAEFILTHSNDIHLTYDGSPSIQYLNILVKPLGEANSNNNFKPFYIFLNSLEYKDFNEKLNIPVKEACDIIIRQSLPDQFLDSFREQVNINPTFKLKRSVIIYVIIENLLPKLNFKKYLGN